jgi:hypothetical protein
VVVDVGGFLNASPRLENVTLRDAYTILLANREARIPAHLTIAGLDHSLPMVSLCSCIHADQM